jgi:hypothetical protein
MDIVLNIYDRWLFTPYVYPKENWPEDSLLRQLISLTLLINIHAVMLYFLSAGFSYWFLFDRRQMEHPLFLKVMNDRHRPLLSFRLESSSTRNQSDVGEHPAHRCTDHRCFPLGNTRLLQVIRQHITSLR